jgi:hypothetical protein
MFVFAFFLLTDELPPVQGTLKKKAKKNNVVYFIKFISNFLKANSLKIVRLS